MIAEPDHGAGRKGEPPAHVLGQERRVEQDQGGQSADCGSDPVAAVDRQIHLTAVARWDQLVDRGVDRRVLAADPHAGEETEQEELPGLHANAVATVAPQIEEQRRP